jgi:predicted dehydrogenase
MLYPTLTRRGFFQSSSAWAGAAVFSRLVGRAAGFESANERPRIAAVGTGSRWDHRATGLEGTYGSGKEFPRYGDIVAVCDVDADRRERASGLVKNWSGHAPESFTDYRQIIDRDDIDVVHISTPDHWHAKIAIEAMLSGKDVYCEKPMTLTIEEGRQMCNVCRKTGRIVQVGTQQRSDLQFLRALAMIRDGRIGKIKNVVCSVGGAPTSPELPPAKPPSNLDWNLWLGPAPQAKFHYLAGPNGETNSWSRCHYEFRWWYETSGGKLTDWGAHHVDIATWGMDKIDTGPVTVDPIMVRHPVPFKDGYPTVDNRYNTATEFNIKATYADGMELTIRHDRDNGILFEGTEGRIFTNRGRLAGKPVEDLADNPLPEGALEEVYKGRSLTDHFRNFFEAVRDRTEPVADVFSHHRALSTCHLAGIAARLGRKIEWDPRAERITNDRQAQGLVGRERRRGFEIES